VSPRMKACRSLVRVEAVFGAERLVKIRAGDLLQHFFFEIIVQVHSSTSSIKHKDREMEL
jgi:hypothetical protein